MPCQLDTVEVQRTRRWPSKPARWPTPEGHRLIHLRRLSPQRILSHVSSQTWRQRGLDTCRLIGTNRNDRPQPQLFDTKAGFTLLPQGPHFFSSIPSTSVKLDGTFATPSSGPRRWRDPLRGQVLRFPRPHSGLRGPERTRTSTALEATRLDARRDSESDHGRWTGSHSTNHDDAMMCLSSAPGYLSPQRRAL